MTETGTLYIVATPIGNLEDITLRALNVLKDVDLVAAEDTRHSQKLLNHFDIRTKTTALHDHNEGQRAKQLLQLLHNGQSIALISDAGTPLISDPGYGLVNHCRAANVNVVPIPGPSALITALCASGMATDQFRFIGFLPAKQQAKQHQLAQIIDEQGTSIFYESPRRIADSVKAIIDVLGENRDVSVAKELTKTFETFYRGSAIEVLQWLQADNDHQRGEFVLMVGGVTQDKSHISSEAAALLKSLAVDLPLKKAAAITAQHYGLKKNALYQYGLEHHE